jgi:hypothetical protein
MLRLDEFHGRSVYFYEATEGIVVEYVLARRQNKAQVIHKI